MDYCALSQSRRIRYPQQCINNVSAVSANDVWAVGDYHDANNDPYQTLVEHWNGTAWWVVFSPSLGSSDNFLYGITAASASDVWAVGSYMANSTGNTLVEHWNGTAWSVVSSPNQGASELREVESVSASDIWAVGNFFDTMYETLTEHWDGTSWTVVPSPSDGLSDQLYGVSAVSANDVWAVGSTTGGTLTEHWDGTSWTIVPSPSPQGYAISLNGVAAVSANDVWAAGTFTDYSDALHTLLEHYTGCSVTPSPTSTSGPPSVTYTATRAPTQSTSTPPAATSTSVRASSTAIATMTMVPGTTTTTATAILTATAASHTATAMRPATTSTPTTITTPTSCPVQYSDVPVGSTFYPFVRCLACMGIISGYPDGTFKPNNDVTRGQLSKIVSNAAGFNDHQPNQMFQDVSLSSTFQVFIGRLASRGYINGYACGGAGEQCVPPGNLPYFHPNDNATRGQISKIASNSARFSDTPSRQQFEDVPVGSTYYTYTYRLVSRSIMGGYPCGGVGEPCVPPANLPYFRPNNNATRRQTSKIVGNTFFSNCNPPAR